MCLHGISRTVQLIHVICGTYIAYGSLMCHVVFGDDVMHINEWAGLNVKILKCSYFKNCMSVLFHIGHYNVDS